MHRKNLLPLLVPLAVLLLAACGGSSASGSAVAPARSSTGVAAGVPPEQAPADRAQAGQAQTGQAQTGQGQAAQGSKPAADSTVPVPSVPAGTKLQRSARMELQVPDGRFDDAWNGIRSIFNQAGGFLSGADAQSPT